MYRTLYYPKDYNSLFLSEPKAPGFPNLLNGPGLLKGVIRVRRGENLTFLRSDELNYFTYIRRHLMILTLVNGTHEYRNPGSVTFP